MRAFISGQAGRAIAHGAVPYRLEVSHPDKRVTCSSTELFHVFQDAGDVVSVETTEGDLMGELVRRWSCDRALQLLIILLDRTEATDTRLAAAECIDELLATPTVSEFVKSRLYSAPLPGSADLVGAFEYSRSFGSSAAVAVLRELETNQDVIRRRFEAWDSLSMEFFDSVSAKTVFRQALIEEEGFLRAVTGEQSGDAIRFHLLASPRFRGNARAREVIMQWTSHFRDQRVVVDQGIDTETEFVSKRGGQRGRQRHSGARTFESIAKQKEEIKALIRSDRQEQALRYTEQLIEMQKQLSEREHLAKSLCDLAQYAKSVSNAPLQLQLAERAVAEVPEDAWSHAQCGDALRQFGRYQDALTQYQRCAQLGSELIGLCGQAEIFKDMGNFDQALTILRDCIDRYPSDSVPQASHASSLDMLGQFDSALAEYERLKAKYPYDVALMNGRARVLRDMSRFDEARRQLQEAIDMYPQDSIAFVAKAEVQRAEGNLGDALESYSFAIGKFPDFLAPYTGHARVLRDLGRFPAAKRAFERVIQLFPAASDGYVGVAQTLRRSGRVVESLAAFESARRRFPESHSWRVGIATVLAATGELEQALQLVQTGGSPATRGEWIAFHTRATMMMKAGRISEAAEMLEYGLRETPWAVERHYFQTALATVRLMGRQFKSAAELAAAATSPQISAVARVIELHAYGELGDRHAFDSLYQQKWVGASQVVVDIRSQLERRFRGPASRGRRQTIASDAWLADAEVTALLLAA
jgi:tetratricopeptide (TPR) repeat protein